VTYNGIIMTRRSTRNRVRDRRIALGLTQAELAERAGVSRTAVTAIEGERLVPSVAAALTLSEALGWTVEQLFGPNCASPPAQVWAWEPRTTTPACWQAEVSGKTVCYPSSSTPMLTPLPDVAGAGSTSLPEETLVMACCDPAAGLLASRFASATGLRLLILPRSSKQAIEMLKNGLVHLAGMHLSTPVQPQRNSEVVLQTLGSGYEMVRIAHWQEGIAISPTEKIKSVSAAKKARLTWIGREPGSGARQCLDRLLDNRSEPRHIARNHRGVAEAVQSGWADAGICVQLASAEAGLDFLPVQSEAYDACFPAAMRDDRRIKAFLNVIRSPAYRKLLSELPGYDSSETGNTWSVQ